MIYKENCPDCDSDNTIKKGFRRTKEKDDVQRYLCKNCGFSFSEWYGGGLWLPKFNKNFHIVKLICYLGKKTDMSSREISKFLPEKISHQGVINIFKRFSVYADDFANEIEEINSQFD